MNIGLGHPLGNPIRTTINGPSPLHFFRRYIGAALLSNETGMHQALVDAAKAGFRIDYHQAALTPVGVHLLYTLRLVEPDTWRCREHRNCMFNPRCHAVILIEALDAADAVRFSRPKQPPSSAPTSIAGRPMPLFV